MSWKWDERNPFPGYAAVAERMGISVTYARKLVRSLEKKQLLRRQVRSGQTNIFDFAGANGHEVAGGYRGRIEEEMTTAQIARATEPARKCMASDYENCEG